MHMIQRSKPPVTITHISPSYHLLESSLPFPAVAFLARVGVCERFIENPCGLRESVGFLQVLWQHIVFGQVPRHNSHHLRWHYTLMYCKY